MNNRPAALSFGWNLGIISGLFAALQVLISASSARANIASIESMRWALARVTTGGGNPVPLIGSLAPTRAGHICVHDCHGRDLPRPLLVRWPTHRLCEREPRWRGRGLPGCAAQRATLDSVRHHHLGAACMPMAPSRGCWRRHVMALAWVFNSAAC